MQIDLYTQSGGFLRSITRATHPRHLEIINSRSERYYNLLDKQLLNET